MRFAEWRKGVPLITHRYSSVHRPFVTKYDLGQTSYKCQQALRKCCTRFKQCC